MLRAGKTSCTRGNITMLEGETVFLPNSSMDKPDGGLKTKGVVWTPHKWGKVCCVDCLKSDKITVKQRFYKPVYQEKWTEFIVFDRYSCGECTKTFSSIAPECLAILPVDIMLRFPYVTTADTATGRTGHLLHSSIVRNMTTQVVNGGSVAGFRAQIIERREHAWALQHAIWLRHRERVKLASAAFVSADPAPTFPSQQDCAALSFPSNATLLKLLCKHLEANEEIETRAMQQIDGIIICGDASHKITKLIYTNMAQSKVFHGVYTLMNEDHQVIYAMSRSDSSVLHVMVLSLLLTRWSPSGLSGLGAWKSCGPAC